MSSPASDGSGADQQDPSSTGLAGLDSLNMISCPEFPGAAVHHAAVCESNVSLLF